MVKLLVVGWDGASYNHLEKYEPSFYSSLENNGKLLPEKVYRGIPIDSGTAWTTITTGLKVEEHGFLSINNLVKNKEFLEYTKKVCEKIPLKKLRTYLYYGLNKTFNTAERTPRSYDVPYKRIWDYVEEKSLTLGVPLTYPAWKHNGVMFSGIPAPLNNPEKPDAYPERFRKYRERYNGYFYVEGKRSPLEDEERPNLEEYRENVYMYNERAFDTVEELCEMKDFELVFAVFPVIDDLLHSIRFSEEEEKVEKAYHWIDKRTEELAESLEPENILILSDHGMMPASKSLNPYLYPGTGMDHDSMNGVWASDHDFDLSFQKEVTPRIYEMFEEGEFEPEEKEFDDEDEGFEGISV